ncbi:MAG TPA: zinc-binding dehydrogenase [Acidimicrobiia bacterium]|jgi:NADPH:quinone reductase|nr:zinc-binding dehydrogenase [Acidimicrobiia bacterium]
MSEMRTWRTHEYGQPLDVLQLDTVPVPEPDAGEVRVRVQAIPLNLNDLERITGGNMMVRPDLPYAPGMEVMGVVDACGPGAESWQDARVVAMPKQAFGGYAEYAICPKVSVFTMPDDIALPDAAALYFPFHLAWLGLFDRAELRQGEAVLIQAAAGGAGSAAVQLAADAGARVFATAGTDEKVALCRELGADIAINYSETDFAEVVMAETDNRGVDVVFDTVGEAVTEASMKCTAYNGRYVIMGFASDKTVADEPFYVPRRVAAGNLKLCGVLLAYAEPAVATMVKQAMGFNFLSRELGEHITREVVDLVRAGRVRPVIGSVIGFDEVPAAIDAMAKRRTTGRTIALV